MSLIEQPNETISRILLYLAGSNTVQSLDPVARTHSKLTAISRPIMFRKMKIIVQEGDMSSTQNPFEAAISGLSFLPRVAFHIREIEIIAPPQTEVEPHRKLRIQSDALMSLCNAAILPHLQSITVQGARWADPPTNQVARKKHAFTNARSVT